MDCNAQSSADRDAVSASVLRRTEANRNAKDSSDFARMSMAAGLIKSRAGPNLFPFHELALSSCYTHNPYALDLTKVRRYYSVNFNPMTNASGSRETKKIQMPCNSQKLRHFRTILIVKIVSLTNGTEHDNLKGRRVREAALSNGVGVQYCLVS